MKIDKHKFLLLFSYIGTKYSGVQRQSNRIPQPDTKPDITVQFFIEQALETINPPPCEPVKVNVSSRTDRGVHAIENSAQIEIIHPNSPETYYPSMLIETGNEYLKSHNHDIKLNKIHLISPEFHFRKHIKWRSYYYRLAVVKPEIANQAAFQPETYLPINEFNRCSLLRIPINLDLDLMREAVQSFKGTHDFTNFAAFSRSLTYFSSDYFTRTIDQLTLTQLDLEPLQAIDESYRNINLYEFTITSKGFLYRQIRRMIGSIVAVGSGHLPIKHFNLLLNEPDKHKWTNQMITAPPEGLYLSKIKYNPKDFLNPPEKTYYDAKLGSILETQKKTIKINLDEENVLDEENLESNDHFEDENEIKIF